MVGASSARTGTPALSATCNPSHHVPFTRLPDTNLPHSLRMSGTSLPGRGIICQVPKPGSLNPHRERASSQNRARRKAA